MTKKNRPSFIVGNIFELVTRPREIAYPIAISDWEFLKQKVSEIEDSSSLFKTIGSVLMGVAGSALLATLTLQESISSVISVVCWIIGFVCLGVAGLCYLFDNKYNKNRLSGSKQNVLDQMNKLERQFQSSAPSKGNRN